MRTRWFRRPSVRPERRRPGRPYFIDADDFEFSDDDDDLLADWMFGFPTEFLTL